MTPPLVSVIIPTYNRCVLVQKTIDSVLAQTFQDFEVTVVDDGSSDGTGQALTYYGDRINYLYQENAGESVARQHGVENSQGAYLAFLDSDDIWLPKKLARQIDVLLEHPDIGFVYCWASMIDGDGQRIRLPPLGYGIDPGKMSLGQLLENNFIVAPGSSLLVRRSAYNAINGFDQTIQFAEDWDFCLRLANRFKFACVPTPMVEVRLHKRGWLQRSENLNRMLQDHLRIVDGFAHSASTQSKALMQSAITSKANRYARVAFEHFAYGQSEKGRELLTQACVLAPEIWADRNLFIRKGAEFATLLTDSSNDKQALAFAELVAANLPTHLVDAGVTLSMMLAQTHKALANFYSQIGDTVATRRNALQAVRHNPAWLRNRGVVSLLLRSLTGHLAKGALRWFEDFTSSDEVIFADLTFHRANGS